MLMKFKQWHIFNNIFKNVISVTCTNWLKKNLTFVPIALVPAVQVTEGKCQSYGKENQVISC